MSLARIASWIESHPKTLGAVMALIGMSGWIIRQWGRINELQRDVREIKSRMDRRDIYERERRKEEAQRHQEVLDQIAELRGVILNGRMQP